MLTALTLEDGVARLDLRLTCLIGKRIVTVVVNAKAYKTLRLATRSPYFTL